MTGWFNEFSYTMFDSSEFAVRSVALFLGGNFSTDGVYAMGDRGLTALYGGVNTCPIPSYVPATYPVTTILGVDTGMTNANGDPLYEEQESISMEPLTSNHPHYSHQQALYITTIAASGAGMSDGWLWEVIV